MKQGILDNPLLLIAITFVLYYLAKKLQERTGWVILNPILLTILAVIAYLKITGVSYDNYSAAGKQIEFWLKPAIVALAIPLHQQLHHIRRQFVLLLFSQLAGCISGIISVVLVAQCFGASRDVIVSLSPKSVTTPIAMEVCAAQGGIPSLTAAIVVAVGLFGAIFGFKVLQIARIKSPIAQSLSMGTASHAVGTSKALEKGGEKYGAFASLGLIANGVFTAILTPIILRILGI